MKKHDFLIVRDFEDSCKEPEWKGCRRQYSSPRERSLSEFAEWFSIESAVQCGPELGPQIRDVLPAEVSFGTVSAKLLYQAALMYLNRDSLQLNWGRVQQKGEMDYEQLVTQLAATKWPETAETLPVLEEFLGFVDQIDGDVAYVTLTAQSGEVLYGEYPAAELQAHGIHERRRFKCRTIDAGSRVEFELEPIPEQEVSADRERAIQELLRESLGEDDAPQDDY